MSEPAAGHNSVLVEEITFTIRVVPYGSAFRIQIGIFDDFAPDVGVDVSGFGSEHSIAACGLHDVLAISEPKFFGVANYLPLEADAPRCFVEVPVDLND